MARGPIKTNPNFKPVNIPVRSIARRAGQILKQGVAKAASWDPFVKGLMKPLQNYNGRTMQKRKVVPDTQQNNPAGFQARMVNKLQKMNQVKRSQLPDNFNVR